MMKVKQVDTNYLYRNRIVKGWKVVFTMYGVLLIAATAGGWEYLQNYQSFWTWASQGMILSGLLIQLIAGFTYRNLGYVQIMEETITLPDNLQIQLKNIKKAVIRPSQRGIWQVTLDERPIELQLKKEDLSQLEEILKQQHIGIVHTNLLRQLQAWITGAKKGD